MQEEMGQMDVFTPEMAEKIARIWARSLITLVDVRFRTITANGAE